MGSASLSTNGQEEKSTLSFLSLCLFLLTIFVIIIFLIARITVLFFYHLLVCHFSDTFSQSTAAYEYNIR
jgi:hypothetical protein